ncbi:MAG: hypothetical protein AAGA92_05180 [Planctomycetota bacterium]
MRSINSRHAVGCQRLALAVCLLLCSLGCGKREATPPPSSALSKPRPRAANLSVLVVGDGVVAEALGRLRGEWAERAGAELRVEQASLAELLESETLPADVLIYPPSATGALHGRGWLRPVRDSVLDDDDFDYGDLLPAVRPAMVFDGQTVAVPLGLPPLMRLNGTAVKSGATDPTALAHELIARALALLPERRTDALLFDPDSMRPRLTTPVMERALGNLAAELRPPGGTANDLPTWQLGWPALWGEPPEGVPAAESLQRKPQVYDEVTDKWRSTTSRGPVTLLGYRGRVASVSADSRNATSAFRLLGWMASGDAAAQLSSSSDETLFFRRSQIEQANLWPGVSAWPGAAEAAAESLLVERPLLLPRIAGWDEYAAALGEAVLAAAAGDAQPAESLRVAAQRWEAITERLGRQTQAEQYRAHLETEPRRR